MNEKPENILGICFECLDNQKHHEFDTDHEEYYCEHNQTWAVLSRDGQTWQISWPVSKAMFLHYRENAVRIFKQIHEQQTPGGRLLHS